MQRLEDGSAVPDGMLFQILLSTGNDETSPLYHHHHRRTIPVNPLTDGAARIPEWGGISTLSTEKVLTIKKRTNSTTGASLNSGGVAPYAPPSATPMLLTTREVFLSSEFGGGDRIF